MQQPFRPHTNMPFAFDGPGGDLQAARRRAALTRALFEEPEVLEVIKRRLTLREPIAADARPASLGKILDHARDCGVLIEDGKGAFDVAGPQARSYLSGAWLEEFMALLLIEAGCDEVRFSQKVLWRAGIDGSLHGNEIDALGLHRDRLVLVSCKALAFDTLTRTHSDDRVFSAMMELAYWNDHFGQGRALAILATTADFYDEEARRFRSPKLVERARVMDLVVLPADLGSSERCLDQLRKRLQGA